MDIIAIVRVGLGYEGYCATCERWYDFGKDPEIFDGPRQAAREIPPRRGSRHRFSPWILGPQVANFKPWPTP